MGIQHQQQDPFVKPQLDVQNPDQFLRLPLSDNAPQVQAEAQAPQSDYVILRHKQTGAESRVHRSLLGDVTNIGDFDVRDEEPQQRTPMGQPEETPQPTPVNQPGSLFTSDETPTGDQPGATIPEGSGTAVAPDGRTEVVDPSRQVLAPNPATDRTDAGAVPREYTPVSAVHTTTHTTDQNVLGAGAVPDAIRPTVPAEAAHTAAAGAAAAGLPAEQVAAVAETAARIASDRQTLSQQSAWTRAMFRGEYGDNAEAEWVRQHEAELGRNQTLYGSREPVAGTRALVTAPAGTPDAPNRQIGFVPPPASGEEARFGVAPHRVAASSATGAAPVAATPGVTTPSTPGSPAASGGWTPLPGQKPITPPAAVKPPAPAAPPAVPGTPSVVGDTQAPPVAAGARPIAAPSSLPKPGVSAPSLATTPPSSPPSGSARVNDDYAPHPQIVDTRAVDEGARELPPPALPTGTPAPPPEIVDTRAADEGAFAREQNYILPPEQVHTIDDLGPDAKAVVSNGRMTIIERNGNAYMQDPQKPAGQLTYRGNFPTLYDAGTYLDPEKAAAAAGRPYTPQQKPFLSPVGQRGGEEITPGSSQQNMSYPETSLTPVTSVEQAVQSSTPLDSLASLSLANKGSPVIPDTIRSDAYNIAHGISGMLRGEREATWAEPYLNDVARLAYAREEAQQGRQADPRNTPVDYIEHWKDAFYGSDHSVPLVKELDQQMIDYAAARTPPGQKFRWQDAYGANGDKGLISAQVTQVDCGPNAYSTILRSRGYNADPARTFSYMKQYGYHSGQEFQGPSAMVRALKNDAGLDAEQIPIDLKGGGWDKVDQELAQGNPVMISGPGHWWVVSAKDDQGRYYTGPTGLSVAQRSGGWLPRGGFVFNGAANTAVLTHGDVDPNARAVREMGLKPPSSTPANTRANLSTKTEMGAPDRSPMMQNLPERPGTDPVRTMQNLPERAGSTYEFRPLSATGDNWYQSDTPPAAQDDSPLTRFQADPRTRAAVSESVWSNNQPARQGLMQDYQQLDYADRERVFNDALDQGLEEEGITGEDKARWSRALYEIATGTGRLQNVPGENPALNPYMIAGESDGKPGTANRLNSSATGYFQLIQSNRNGSDFAFQGYVPQEYQGNIYDPKAQVRQVVRAIRASSNFRGNPDAAVADKKNKGHWDLIVQKTEPW
jgi:hypothetical protein